MKVYNRDQIDSFLKFIANKAEEIQNSDRYGGYHGPSEGDRLIRDIRAYEAGTWGKIPEQWDKLVKEWARENDPEYAEFKRLKEKFG
jgi:hypothetical protein